MKTWLLWLLGSAVLFSAGDWASKYWADQPGLGRLVLLLLCYLGSVLLWLPAIHEVNRLTVVGVAWSVLGALGTCVMGVACGEDLNWRVIIGGVLAFLAVGVLSSS